MRDPRKAIVEEGYDTIAEAYLTWSSQIEIDPRDRMLDAFFSSYDADANRRLLVAAGFELLIDEVIETVEPEGSVAFLWVLARGRGGATR